jgi:hypothetical protein
MMTSRQIIDGMLRGKKVERIGVRDCPWPETIAAWVEQGYPTRLVHKEPGELRWRRGDGRTEVVTMAAEYEEPVPYWEHFHHDLLEVGNGIEWMPLRSLDELVEETDEWEIRRDGTGAAHKLWKHKSGTPEHIGFRMTTREIWEREYRPHLTPWDPARADPETARRDREEAASQGLFVSYNTALVWEPMRWSMGDITLYESLLLDPAWIHDYCRVYTDLIKQGLAYTFERTGRPDGIWLTEDLGYKNALFASPQVLRELIFPYFKELVDLCHGYDITCVLHSCGSVAEALPLIVEAGFDGLNPIERKAAGNDPFMFAEKYGDRLAFVGGLDARVFETNDKEVIRREVTDYMEGMKARGARFAFASDHSISPRTRYESYLYALQIYREHMMY